MIEPYKNLPLEHVELAWWLDHESVLAENGKVISMEKALARHINVWAPADNLRQAVRNNHGSTVLWRFNPIAWHPDSEHPVTKRWPVRGLLIQTPESPLECIEGLIRWRDWLERYGASPRGSLGYTGLCLLKCSLDRPLWTSVGNLPPINHVDGGRQECHDDAPIHITGPVLSCDMRAAYANTLGRAQYGGRWDHYKPQPIFDKIADKNPLPLIYIHATVDIPNLERLSQLSEANRSGPLITRASKEMPESRRLFWEMEDDRYPHDTQIEGVWTINELRSAEDAGCTVQWNDVWYHAAAEQPFLTWLDCINIGRELGGFASRLAKATGNATWGQFAITKGSKLVYRGPKQKETIAQSPGNPSQKAPDLAEYICGTVRAELYRGMYQAGPDLITAHTDGLWTQGSQIRDWRVNDRADEMRVLSAQGYSVREGDEAWKYTASGVLDPEEQFERLWKNELDDGAVTTL